MIYRTICTQLWTDKKIQQLTVHGKLLFVYLITNPHTHLSGIYYLPKELITKETGLSHTLCNTLFHTLSELERAYYDTETSTVLVVNMFGYQGQGEKNERACANQLIGLHHTPLIGRFLERYPRVKRLCSDTILDTVSTLSKIFPPVPNPLSYSVASPNKSISHSKKKSNGLHEWPADFVLSEEMKSRAIALDLNPFLEFAKFKDHHLSKGSKMVDWEAAWRTWIRKGVEYKEARR